MKQIQQVITVSVQVQEQVMPIRDPGPHCPIRVVCGRSWRSFGAQTHQIMRAIYCMLNSSLSSLFSAGTVTRTPISMWPRAIIYFVLLKFDKPKMQDQPQHYQKIILTMQQSRTLIYQRLQWWQWIKAMKSHLAGKMKFRVTRHLLKRHTDCSAGQKLHNQDLGNLNLP